MKANKGQIERALDAPGADVRLYLLHGPDEAGSRALADRLERAMGPDAERIELDSAVLKGDPARLADEAASISLFGGARHIRLTLANPDDALAAIQALVEAPQTGNPVVAIAGTLRATGAVLKYALEQPSILVFASYAPEGQDADRLAGALAREAGLRIASNDVARRLAAAAAGDRAILQREIEKFALYLDAAPDRPAELDHAVIDALGADADEGDMGRLVDAVMGGNPGQVGGELARLAAVGIEGIPLIRAVLKRALLLAQLRGDVEQGSSVDAVMASGAGKAVFWKEKATVQRQIGLWRSDRL
ncbi:DNA polymerase III subunit delta, partial [Sphingopyxis sp.]|uniref:DNA polymerase III subunit delta n=1 Tax=Sphingopyxis sp. TaxID=1908224 RepID=UPI002ED95137